MHEKVSPKSKIHIFPVTCRAVYQSRQFWCELSSLGDISHRNFCLLSNIMGLNGALLVVLTEKKIHLKNSTAMSLYRNHDPTFQKSKVTSLAVICAASWWRYQLKVTGQSSSLPQQNQPRSHPVGLLVPLGHSFQFMTVHFLFMPYSIQFKWLYWHNVTLCIAQSGFKC